MTSGSALIESILRISSHGVLSWHLDESVKPEQEQRLMDEFEQVAFAGLEPDQRNILWVRHSHAGHHELHFVLPRVELSSGKAFNPCPPGWQKHLAIASRAVMLIVLQETGLEINRAGKDYITVKDPESGEKLRLKGGIYAEHWNLELAGRALEGQDRTGTERTGSPDPVTVQRLEQELEPIVQSRAQYNRGRYPTPACQLEIERNFTLPDTEPRLWLEVPASPGHHSVHPDRRDMQWMGSDERGREEDSDLAPGNNRAVGTERILGSAERPDMGHLQRAGAVPRPGRQGLSADPRRAGLSATREQWASRTLGE